MYCIKCSGNINPAMFVFNNSTFDHLAAAFATIMSVCPSVCHTRESRLATIRLVHHCAAISATAELLH